MQKNLVMATYINCCIFWKNKNLHFYVHLNLIDLNKKCWKVYKQNRTEHDFVKDVYKLHRLQTLNM